MPPLSVDYMAYPAIVALEARIGAGSHADVIDDMWLNISPLYFLLADGFTMAAQPRLEDNSGQKCDASIRKIVQGDVRVVIFSASPSHEHQNQASRWEENKIRFKGCLGQMHTTKPGSKTLFGVVTIGKASQFFRYRCQQSVLQCLHDESEAYAFKDHRADVDR
ncbi:MAG: hypothetical protein M1840_008640 [Geoglossum simile]|nr:MAG: hypothetical protein M1840_008640 [Geoglossum simile]